MLITKQVGEATERIAKLPYCQASERTSPYRHRLFEKIEIAMTFDGTGDDKISLEGLEEGYRSHSWIWKTKTVMEVGVHSASSKPVGTGTEATAPVRVVLRRIRTERVTVSRKCSDYFSVRSPYHNRGNYTSVPFESLREIRSSPSIPSSICIFLSDTCPTLYNVSYLGSR